MQTSLASATGSRPWVSTFQKFIPTYHLANDMPTSKPSQTPSSPPSARASRTRSSPGTAGCGGPAPSPAGLGYVKKPGGRDRRPHKQNWLRVFGKAEAARIGQGVWAQLHARAGPSEQWWDSVAEYGEGMCVIAASLCHLRPESRNSTRANLVSQYRKVTL
jgi:hypothetical protein